MLFSKNNLIKNFLHNRSRICVKNLPKFIDDNRLRTLFSEKGEITDVKLMRTKYFSYPILDSFECLCLWLCHFDSYRIS